MLSWGVPTSVLAIRSPNLILIEWIVFTDLQVYLGPCVVYTRPCRAIIHQINSRKHLGEVPQDFEDFSADAGGAREIFVCPKAPCLVSSFGFSWVSLKTCVLDLQDCLNPCFGA